MRLIDADKINPSDVIGGNNDFASDIRKAMQDLIDIQPTAYNIDKVVERIDGIMEDESIRFCNQAVSAAKGIAKLGGATTGEHSNGWIPCSERLPEESLNSVIGWDEYMKRCCFVQYYAGQWQLAGKNKYGESVKIIAWQPVPEPYKLEGE